MSNEVDRIQVNRNYQVNGAGSQQERANQETKNEVASKQPETTQVAAGDILSFMANQAIDVRPKKVDKVLNVSDYVTAEQAQRIAGFVSQFEDDVSESLKTIDKELGSDVLSDSAKMGLALGMFKADKMGAVSVDKAELQKAQMARVPDVNKYVTPAQAKRIGGFINQFEDVIVKGLQEIEKELGADALASEAKMDLAIELFKVRNM